MLFLRLLLRVDAQNGRLPTFKAFDEENRRYIAVRCEIVAGKKSAMVRSSKLNSNQQLRRFRRDFNILATRNDKKAEIVRLEIAGRSTSQKGNDRVSASMGFVISWIFIDIPPNFIGRANTSIPRTQSHP